MEVLSYLTEYHYLTGIMLAMGLAALAVSAIYFKRHREMRLFFYYMVFSVSQICADMAVHLSPKSRLLAIVSGIVTLCFMLFENIACTLFIRRQLRSATHRRIAIGTLIAFGVSTAAVMFFKKGIFAFLVIDCVTLTIACFLYFFELFLYTPDRPIEDKPAFWVITGILFLNCCSIPMYLSTNKANIYFDKYFALNLILYIVLYSMLIRAFLCPAKVRSARRIVSLELGAHGNIEPINNLP
jgi:hypothetical protein